MTKAGTNTKPKTETNIDTEPKTERQRLRLGNRDRAIEAKIG